MDAKNSRKEIERIKQQVTGKLERHFGKTLEGATGRQLYAAVALTVRDRIMDQWCDTEACCTTGTKRLYYLSFEFLIGRTLGDNLISLGVKEQYEAALAELGKSLGDAEDMEADAGLGNGGLGRLAACFMNSLATLGLPAYGCGIRYEYGLFKQKIVDGYQIELPDPWLEDGNVWEIPKPEEQQEIHFGGAVCSYMEGGRMKFYVKDAVKVIAVPYDMPVLGYEGGVVNTLRLWSARSPKRIDLDQFSHGNYIKAMEEKEMAEVLSKILYPEDRHTEGKTLRLRQQYFFTSATLQWIIRGCKERGDSLHRLYDFVQIHINDTHPAIAIPELMRILMDQEGMGWDEAWDITTKTFAYTNHTIMSEALEKWPVNLMQRQLPRIYMILDEINRRLVGDLISRFGEDWGKINYMAVISYDYVNMANLCIVGSHSVNGVSGLHTDILKADLFRDYYGVSPEKFVSITNGITHRRWLLGANPALAALIREAIGDGFIREPERLGELTAFAADAAFAERFWSIKQDNKRALAKYVLSHTGHSLDPDSIFDTQVKRLHEYKRQLMNVLHIIYLYNQIVENPSAPFYPRTFLFGAKASPGYHRAKLVIKLINSVAAMVRQNPLTRDKLHVLFIENYGVTLAERIIPATEVSEQISTAGKEASGTGNMKFMMNGALTIGTLDGANVEMRERAGEENIYIFGLKASEVAGIYRTGNKISQEAYNKNQGIRKALDHLIDGILSADKPGLFTDLHNALLFGDNGFPDPYMVLADFEGYHYTHNQVVSDYQNRTLWTAKAIRNVAASGFFSSDRTIGEYNEKIWRL